VLKGTKVDGLYSADPKKDPQAEFIRSATYQDCIERKLGVMDMTAFSLARENKSRSRSSISKLRVNCKERFKAAIRELIFIADSPGNDLGDFA
jgi:uridylate kinase